MTTYASIFTGRNRTTQYQTPFEKVCVDHGIEHLIARPRLPTEMGNIERVCRVADEALCNTPVFTDIEAAQRAVNSWMVTYNANRAARN